MPFQRQHLPWAVSFVAAVVFVSMYLLLFAAPGNFIPGTTVQIMSGSAATQIAADLGDAHIIAHPTLLRLLLRGIGKSESVQTGLYKFDRPQGLFTIAYRLVKGVYGIEPVRLTFTEGITNREVAIKVAGALQGISVEDFQAAADGEEGYLFPDTYFFQPGVDAPSVVRTMRSNFDSRIASLTDTITRSGKSLSEVVTMASLIEKEARTVEDKHIVSGILWNRIKLGMPLQVDAVFGYIYGRDTYSPAPRELQVTSPYNLYTHIGLPPGPIDNPGLESLEAALNPADTEYLYYLTGDDGLMHYARSYAGHQANVRIFLR